MEPDAKVPSPIDLRALTGESNRASPGNAAWPLPKRTSLPVVRPPSKHVFFDGPYGEEIRRHIEAVALLNDWSISDTILYFLREGIRKAP